jgi:hypothetical protein
VAGASKLEALDRDGSALREESVVKIGSIGKGNVGG